MAAALRRASAVAVDTEGASFHRFVDRIYLVQLAAPGIAALVDPVAVADLAPFGALLGDPAVEKVFHDADYDLRTIDRDWGYRARRLFDTRIAAQLVGETAFGLASLLEKYLHVSLSKAHQKADWSVRPLTPEMVAYAAADTAHLLDLRAALEARLVALGRRAWAEEEFRRLEELRWTGAVDGEPAYLRVKGAKTLDPRRLAALRELVEWRDGVARAADKAPFRVMGNDALLAVAKRLPDSPAALETVPDLPRSLARRHGDALLAGVARARALPADELPKIERPPRRPPPDPAYEERLDRLKRARASAAATIGLDPGVLVGRAALEALAREHPRSRAELERIPDLRRWQTDVAGDALVAALG